MKNYLLMASLAIAAGCKDVPLNKSFRCFDANDAAFIGKAGAYEELAKEGMRLEKLITKRSGQTSFSTIESDLLVIRETIWPTNRVPVCWEESTFKKEDQAKRDLVRTAVENTWHDALYIDENNNFQFTGWDKCNDTNSDGIRIKVEDVGPHVKLVGTPLKGRKDGMVLNFTFKNWSEGCQEVEGNNASNTNCIYYIAVHEFGHVLGLAHEQNRSDTDPLLCGPDNRQGPNGNTNVGAWDLFSVMNYCNPYWTNWGELSHDDYLYIRKLYFPKNSGVQCVPTKTFSDVLKKY